MSTTHITAVSNDNEMVEIARNISTREESYVSKSEYKIYKTETIEPLYFKEGKVSHYSPLCTIKVDFNDKEFSKEQLQKFFEQILSYC
jgi:hypothetical protein